MRSGDTVSREPMTIERNQGLFGWKGLGRDRSWDTTIVTCLMIANVFLLLSAFSALPSDGPPGMDFYVFVGLTVLVSALGFGLIRYPDKEAKWGARALVAIVPASLALLLAFFATFGGS